MLRLSTNAVASTIAASNTRYVSPASAWQLLGEVQDRVIAEWQTELPMLKARWKAILGCLMFQYVHGIFTQLVYRRHIPSPEPLLDTGFQLLPEIGPKHFWVSELVFTILFGSFLVWVVSPFFTEKKTFYTVVVVQRLLVHLCCCQALRIVSFMSTVLPGPAHHCLAAEPTATLAWPRHWWQHLVFNFGRQTSRSCGDLIFSSHITFILSFVIGHSYYSKPLVPKVVAWVLALALSLLIIASHKHYTVDVTIAWYTVPLVFLALERRYSTKRKEGADQPVRSMQDILVHTRADIAPSARTTASSSSGYGDSATGVLNLKALRAGRHSRTPSTARLATRPSSSAAHHDAAGGSQLELQLSGLASAGSGIPPMPP
eukprot:jgi/Ulvmu1/11421/UM075_0085.1